jgi:glycosyltransferase involved in cell wall biosynthesis
MSLTNWNLRFWFYKNWFENEKNIFLLRIFRITSSPYRNNNPLISVIIPTYNRSRLLVERAVASVLRQTYPNFEIVIVGDHCTDDTEERLRKIGDARIKFFNLPERGNYPAEPQKRWLVAGTVPNNKALKLAKGDWIASLDDDDEFSPDHLDVLLKHALENKLEMVYGIVQMEKELGKWDNMGSDPLECGHISRTSTLYNSRLKIFKYDTEAWKNLEPADWNLWKRMKEAGVRIGFVNKIVGSHYMEKQQLGI